ncbi:hypothetical protein NDN01_14645 [Sphingomonas sp. QA11]|jgi:ABC-type lipoprotein release transport system permease subunit|uniref:hypothetical protein n=1 Tax=Sphingomonas sp. QA11 TaxID=2950605 RepID=UPI00234BE3FA|nr:MULTISPECIES: hypothetical protein [unclassified Sphingomonas]WCM25303.1 hypothetical protein NDN01_14645 [Sphingomonas sp. QA11]WEJ99930.1 MAG: hypothetical protein P0Y59_24050 [Sphingomonas sp.]
MASKPPTRTPLAGGVLIALGAMGGAVTGLFLYEPVPGFLIGTGIGIALAVAIWLLNVRR